jgi:ornithine cyclodeaminase
MQPSAQAPSAQAYVPFVSVARMMELVHRIGIEPMLVDLAARIEADFRRWPDFDKTPRVASHSDIGVIELMPTSDGQTYGFMFDGWPLTYLKP